MTELNDLEWQEGGRRARWGQGTHSGVLQSALIADGGLGLDGVHEMERGKWETCTIWKKIKFVGFLLLGVAMREWEEPRITSGDFRFWP